MFLVESRERLDDIRKWRSRWWGHDGSGVPASFPGFGTSVAKFVGRKEADRVGSWRLRYFYLRQINSHRCALCVTRKHQLSRSSPRSLSAFVPTVSLWQLVRPSLHSVSPSELPFHGGFYPVSTPITAIRHRWSSFCTWPTYLLLSPESFSRCRLRWTTPPSPHPSSSAGRGRSMELRRGFPPGLASSGWPAGLHPAPGPIAGSDPPAPASCPSAPDVVPDEDQRATRLAPQVGWGWRVAWRRRASFLVPGFGTSVTRFEGQGRKDEEVRGDEPEKGCLLTQNKTVVSKRKQKLRRSSSVVVLLFFGGSALSLSLLITASPLQAGGSLFKSPRQSLESDTGVNHYSLAHWFPARLRTRSPPSAFRLSTPPSPQTGFNKCYKQNKI